MADNEDIKLDEDFELTDELFEEDELLTEDDLEKLMVGVDAEDDILDLPNDEDMLEELDLTDDFPSPDEISNEPKQEKKSTNNKKTEKNSLKYSLLKHKLPIFLGILGFILLTGAGIFYFINAKKPEIKVFDKETPIEKNVDEQNNIDVTKELMPEEDNEKLLFLENKLKSANAEDADDIKKQINQIKQIIKEKEKKETDDYLTNLKSKFDSELKTISPTLFKAHNDSLIMGFVIVDENKGDLDSEVYDVIDAAFNNKRIETINLSILEVADQLNKRLEITALRYEYDRVKNSNIPKIKKLKYFRYNQR